MNQKGYTNIILVVVIVAIIALAGYFVVVKKSSPTNQPTATITETANWKTYQNDEYNFSVMYPATGWLLTKNITDGILVGKAQNPIKSLSVANLYTQRAGNPEVDELSTTITILVYQKDVNLSTLQWLSSAIPDMPKVKSGDLSVALQEANAGKTGLLTYKESKNGTVEISEFGAVILAKYFNYATYFHNVGSPYVYSIELNVPLRYNSPAPSDPDSKYTAVYDQMISTLKFTK